MSPASARFTTILIAFIFPTSASAGTPDRILGEWGTAQQCARAPLMPGGSVMAEPFAFHDGWLRHGTLWCRLAWFPGQSRPDGLFAVARAQCGEDAVRDHRLAALLDNGRLTLVWNEAVANGPLDRCHRNLP